MKEDLQRKVNLMAQNSKIVRNSAKLDFTQAANLGALFFTAENLVASERDIRANRKILKARTGIFNNMRGPAANLALLARMSLKHDPEDYLEKVMAAYDRVKAPRLFKDESLVFTATAMADDTDPALYDETARAAWDTLDKMRSAHPLLTSQDDLTLAHLLNKSSLNVDQLLDDAETIYQTLKPTGFKLKKDTLQSVSIILAMSGQPIPDKCQRFCDIREALKKAGRRIYGPELAVVAAFVDMDLPIEEMVQDVADVDDTLKHVTGFGPLLCGANLRRLYASALVLQTYTESGVASANAVSESVVSTVVFNTIMLIILLIIMMEVTAANSASSAS